MIIYWWLLYEKKLILTHVINISIVVYDNSIGIVVVLVNAINGQSEYVILI